MGRDLRNFKAECWKAGQSEAEEILWGIPGELEAESEVENTPPNPIDDRAQARMPKNPSQPRAAFPDIHKLLREIILLDYTVEDQKAAVRKKVPNELLKIRCGYPTDRTADVNTATEGSTREIAEILRRNNARTPGRRKVLSKRLGGTARGNATSWVGLVEEELLPNRLVSDAGGGDGSPRAQSRIRNTMRDRRKSGLLGQTCDFVNA